MNISPAITRGLGDVLLQVKKFSPQILTAVGVTGVVTAGVLAARATLKLEETVDKGADRIDITKKLVGNGEESSRKITVAYAHNVLDLVKLYGPSVTLGAASLICIISAQGILHKRNATLALAYKSLESTYQRYRERVVEEYGEEVDNEFHRGIRTEEVTDSKGKKVKIKTVDTQSKFGEYTFVFGPNNDNWEGTHEHNEFFLTVQQTHLNDLLRLRGHVFLNEVLDKLGMPRTSAGAVTGWIYDKSNADADSYIDFNMFRLDNAHAREIEGADIGHILLDFNVQGMIYDKIEKH